jgi:hypothetical protein
MLSSKLSIGAQKPAKKPPIDAEPLICKIPVLQNALKILDASCTEDKCDFQKLREIELDRRNLIGILGNRYIGLIHVFFPIGKFGIIESYNWKSVSAQLIEKYHSKYYTAYIVGRASEVGFRFDNATLSKNRALHVLEEMKQQFTLNNVQNIVLKPVWFGRDILQLNQDEADMLNIPKIDYQNPKNPADIKILNQSVQILFMPCQRTLAIQKTVIDSNQVPIDTKPASRQAASSLRDPATIRRPSQSSTHPADASPGKQPPIAAQTPAGADGAAKRIAADTSASKQPNHDTPNLQGHESDNYSPSPENCIVYKKGSRFLSFTYKHNAHGACLATPNNAKNNCVRWCLQKKLKAYLKLANLDGIVLSSCIDPFGLLDFLCPEEFCRGLYDHHVNCYQECHCRDSFISYPLFWSMCEVPFPGFLVGKSIEWWNQCT